MQSVLINGTVGAGKTTLATAIGGRLSALGVPRAVLDLDAIRDVSPAPPGDPFNHELELRNLAAIARNFAHAGVERVILAGVVEQRSEISRYASALGGGSLNLVRLQAPVGVLRARLELRHPDPDEREWHLRRVTELDQILRAADLDELVLDSGCFTPDELAGQVITWLGWHQTR